MNQNCGNCEHENDNVNGIDCLECIIRNHELTDNWEPKKEEETIEHKCDYCKKTGKCYESNGFWFCDGVCGANCHGKEEAKKEAEK